MNRDVSVEPEIVITVVVVPAQAPELLTSLPWIER